MDFLVSRILDGALENSHRRVHVGLAGFPKYARQIVSFPAENRAVGRDAKIAGYRFPRGGNRDLAEMLAPERRISASRGHLGIWLRSRLSLSEKRL